jgi:predicted TIM-barrel fold metal-dependent hydrolase
MGLAIHIMFGMGGEHGSSEEDESDFFKRITSLSTINNERTAASMMPTLNHFILGGVLHRHPRLRIGFTETGIGWVPFWLEQTDDNFLRHRFWTNCDLPMLPSEYWARSCYATFQIDYYGLRNRDLLGVETIMWSTDYPHTGADWPNSQRTVGEERRLTPLSDAEAELIFSDNCRRLYHLPRS